jgi:replicative DNA helicase
VSEAEVRDLNPHIDSADPERLLLGVLIASRTAREAVEPMLHPSDFARYGHELVYRAVVWLSGRGDPVDPTVVAGALERAGYTRQAGDLAAVREIVEGAAASTADHAVKYAEIVRDRAQHRVLGKAGRRLLQLGDDPSSDASEAIELAVKAVEAASERIHGKAGGDDLGAVLDASIDRLQQGEDGFSSGWPDLDGLTGGFRPGTLTVVAGSTSAGKSVVAECVALQVAARGVPVYAASLEMSVHEWMQRAYANVGSVSLSRLTQGNDGMTEDDWRRVAAARARMDGWPLRVDDRETTTVPDIRAGARAWFRQRDCPGLVVVDYLQLVKPTGRHGNREREVAEVAEDLRAMARTLAAPVLALSQLNDDHVKTGKRPGLQGLRESRVIAQAAHAVLILWRDAVKAPAVLEVNVAKNRNGPVGEFVLTWEGVYARARSQAGAGMVQESLLGGAE